MRLWLADGVYGGGGGGDGGVGGKLMTSRDHK